jgi:hypothetical protein
MCTRWETIHCVQISMDYYYFNITFMAFQKPATMYHHICTVSVGGIYVGEYLILHSPK